MNNPYCCMTDQQLIEEANSETVLHTIPLFREIFRRFREDVAAVDADFAAAGLERPQPVSINSAPRPIA